MKKILMAVGALVCFSLGGAVAVFATSGTPEIDRANATLNLQGQLSTVRCTGEDKLPYETLSAGPAGLAGSETQKLPDPTNYSLSGKVTITGVSWTINLATKRGVFTGTITLVNSAGAVTYKGTLTLITQGVPAPGAGVPARGWINAKFVGPEDGVPDTPPNDDNLLANTEFVLATTGAMGEFGDASGIAPGYPDFSVVTNVAPVALDGHC
jgi:hypothetical protein